MIQLLATKYTRHIAYCLFLLFTASMAPVYGSVGKGYSFRSMVKPVSSFGWTSPANPVFVNKGFADGAVKEEPVKEMAPEKAFIDGPSQPEMASFKSVGADNMVDLFSGDFSYNIPLLDVGGYPVNIFYNGGISPEQEASWVGLGWNINPGSISRNMRGIPDDFNGQDTLIEYQAMKPNKTWGARGGLSVEWLGQQTLGGSLGINLGISYNNYLGPAAELGIRGGLNVMMSPKVGTEKSVDSLSVGLKLGISATASSRYGLTVAPNVSFSANYFTKSRGIGGALGLSTGYNSRTGISDLQLNAQASLNKDMAKEGEKTDFRSNSVSLGSAISFARSSYIPTLRSVVTNSAFSAHGQAGFGLMGGAAMADLEIYFQKSQIMLNDRVQRKPMVGYLYYQNANGNPNAVMDFARFNDKEVTPETPVVSAPQYSYDVFSIQGEGTGGTVRAYRNDLGFVRDNVTTSRGSSASVGADVAPPGHFGGNFGVINSPTSTGEWQLMNGLKTLPGFQKNANGQEYAYFRSPGESSVLDPAQYDSIGGTDLVRYKLGGNGRTPSIQAALQRFPADGTVAADVPLWQYKSTPSRKKRTQVFSFLMAEEASFVGLDREIKSYDPVTLLDTNHLLKFQKFPRYGSYRKKHHISQVTVTEGDGKRYVYGIPVYNLVQKDFSVTVDGDNPASAQVVSIDANEASSQSVHLDDKAKQDGFVQITQTPSYAHSFLLSGLLSPDYVDITGNGITEDDMGTSVKFNYTQWSNHKWRTPLTDNASANFNPGNLSEKKDDKGVISYGERESWYLHSIESKTIIAFFTVADRLDGKGTVDSLQGRNASDHSMKSLKQIDLYNKADLKLNGMGGARPIKTVHFGYSYKLSKGTPDNTTANTGKLTLDSIWFTFNGQSRVSKNKYVFDYGGTEKENPDYTLNNTDRWGGYKPASANPNALPNRDYSYVLQDTMYKYYAAAWSLRKILLPSGGQIEVDYEGDDYAYVQNRRAAQMMKIEGFAKSPASGYNKYLYDVMRNGDNFVFTPKDYVFIKVPQACNSKEEVKAKYLEGLTQLAFRLAVQMPKGKEFVPCYATVEDYDKTSDPTVIWVKLNRLDKLPPLSLSAAEYLREHLPGQAFKGYDLSEGNLLDAAAAMIKILGQIGKQLQDPISQIWGESKAREVNLAESFVRLNNPYGLKYGGGHRVKSVKLKDNWNAMTKKNGVGQFNSIYGQEYDYTTTEVRDGKVQRISSGVASYEPTIGGDENPMQTIMQIADKLPLGPTTYGAVEMPVLDAFFPAPHVGYSKVTVRSVNRNPEKKSRSGVGKQVTEFFTAKDFPVYYDHTRIDPSSNKEEHKSSLTAFLFKYAFDSRALSQGFVVAVNDMHGKLKSQSSYAENDTLTRINYTRNYYRNTGDKGLNEKFDFIHQSLNGQVLPGNMGVDVELMTDTREFSVKTSSLEVQAQGDLFPLFFAFWIPSVWPVIGNSESTYRAVTTTKVVNYHAVLDSVVVIDKGSVVSTKNLVYDAETGSVVVNRTNNEFDKPIYTVNYPAYWAYSGMGLAYKNIDAAYQGISFYDGKIVSGNVPDSMLESGDELLITNTGAIPANCGGRFVSDPSVRKLWVFDRVRNSQPLTSTVHDFIFIDSTGKPYTRDNISFRIIRSGKRNMLGASVAGITLMTNPISQVSGKQMLVINDTSQVINASAVDFREKWQTDNGMFRKFKLVFNSLTCQYTEQEDCLTGYLEKIINPYTKGLLGNFRGFRSYVFYNDRDGDKTFTDTLKLQKAGFLKEFEPFWTFNGSKNIIPAVLPAPPLISKWIENNRATRFNAKGMELETKDALDIYTAAQYGYSKTTPVAIANNARYNEIANDGFEDHFYSDMLNNNNVNACAKPHADFSSMAFAQIVNESIAQVSAHTGKYMLAIEQNSYASRVFPVGAPIDSFNLNNYRKDTTQDLHDFGGVLESKYSVPVNLTWSPVSAAFNVDNVASLDLRVHPVDTFTNITGTSYTRSHYYELDLAQYLVVAATGDYTVDVAGYINDGSPNFNATVKVSVYDSLGTLMNTYQSPWGNAPMGSKIMRLCAGTYKVVYTLASNFTENETGTPEQQAGTETFTAYWNLPKGYKSLDKQDGCVYTIPLPATDSMLNTLFSVPMDKDMVFSAWVRETCPTSAPCNVTTYANNGVSILFNGGSGTATNLKPAGPIIDGWQRYEGYFKAPAGSTTMTVRFDNTSSRAIYFDDIRIHPFNANMKTYVYDPVNLRLAAEMDANNYASFYEYDAEGTLIRTKAETREGIKTITESRSSKQKKVTTIQE